MCAHWFVFFVLFFFCGECAVGSIKEVGENVDMFSGFALNQDDGW